MKSLDLNQSVIIDYLIYGFSDSDSSVWKNILKLSPGIISKFQKIILIYYHILLNKKIIFIKDKNDAKIDLREAIINDIESQLASDVPLGVFFYLGE